MPPSSPTADAGSPATTGEAAALVRGIVGTAGHIDHGKTLLLKALTGVDCDRWKEEKRRGITIDLGFTHLHEDGVQVGFIDVPGHHRFLHNALAGMGGIRVVLLVVAATEGVMPQTREHLAICSLLGIPRAVVALTKVDLAAPDLVELAELDVEELLEGTPFEGSPVLRVSSVSGEGLEDLKAVLLEQIREHGAAADPEAPVRLPVDRAFHLKGLGVVITGTLTAGTIRAGDSLEMLPQRKTVRVRGIQVHGESREAAFAGERTSLQLAGVDLEEIERGRQLTSRGTLAESRLLCARIRLLPDAPGPLTGWSDIRFFILSTEVQGRVKPLDPVPLKPGEEGLVLVRLARPVPVIRGDRCILRRLTPATTLGGGEVLDPAWARLRKLSLEDDLAGLRADAGRAIRHWVARARYRGLPAEDVAMRLGWSGERAAERLEALAAEGGLVEIPGAGGSKAQRRWLDQSAIEETATRAKKILEDAFARDRLAQAMPKAEFVRRLLPGATSPMIQWFLETLEKDEVIALGADAVTLPGYRVELKGREAEAAEVLVAKLRQHGLSPPPVDGLIQEHGLDPASAKNALRFLHAMGTLLLLSNEIWITAEAVQGMFAKMKELGWEQFSVPEFKETFDVSRRWAIPLLEYCDSCGVTRRAGDVRILIPDSPPE